MTEVTPNLPHCGNFCKYCFMGTLLQLASQFEAIAPEEDKPLLVPVYSPRTERLSRSDGIA